MENPNFICNLTNNALQKTKKINSQQPFVGNEHLTAAENKLLGLANIALEREIN